jgi:hypothetical protein
MPRPSSRDETGAVNAPRESSSPLVRFVADYAIELLSVVGVGVAIFLVINWGTISLNQRLLCLMFLALVLHEWEEMRCPGGFIEIMASTFGIRHPVPKTARLGVEAYILVVVFVPIFFPTVGWMFMAPMFLGLFEAFIHTVGIKITHRHHPYTPGMATAVVLMLPIAVVGIAHAISTDLLHWWEWPVALIYMFAGFAIMQASIIHSVGLTYPDMIKRLAGRGEPTAE